MSMRPCRGVDGGGLGLYLLPLRAIAIEGRLRLPCQWAVSPCEALTREVTRRDQGWVDKTTGGLSCDR